MIMYNNKQYQAIADALRETRESVEAAFEDGTALQAAALAAVDTAIVKVGNRLQATHRGAYPFKPSRFFEAAGLDQS
jgi:urease accessory protein UreF